MITRLLVANRGEIARRVFRTCRDLGIETVAVHSDADAAMPFVHDADMAVRLPGHSSGETYLRGDLIIEAARRAEADAIHPGYGFLSENAAFAQAVIDAGLIWIGPSPESIERMGSKIESKKLMEAAGVPVLGTLTGVTATEGDLPLLVKASAGGGGRGMRIVRSLEGLDGEIAAAQSEAKSAFGDGTVFVEPYIENGRHIEVQIIGTRDGVLVFGERDCSVQRRHQKIIEESPAPGLPQATREAFHKAARAAAAAINYRGAGTVEFLYDPAKDRFYFLEMNTRLQVEHPVTEAAYDVDIVALQIEVAETPDGDIPATQSEAGHLGTHAGNPSPLGHSIEVRLYAEDPARGYQPQSGRITAFEIPGVITEFDNPEVAGIRLDSGVKAGDTVGTFYDAMIAKVIVWAPTRDEALRRLAGTLARARIHGLTTNRDFLVRLLRDPVVTEARMHTTWLDGIDAATFGANPGPDALALSAFASAIANAIEAQQGARVQSRIPVGFRNVVAQPHVTTYRHGDDEIDVHWFGGTSFRSADLSDLTVLSATSDRVTLEQQGVRREFAVTTVGDQVDVDSSLGHVALIRKPRFVDPSTQVAAGSLLAPMPGSVVSVCVAVGDSVEAGQSVLVLEAMKMQHTITAPAVGVITELNVIEGQQVNAGAVMAVVSQEESA